MARAVRLEVQSLSFARARAHINQPLLLFSDSLDVPFLSRFGVEAFPLLNEARMAEESGRRKRRRPTSKLASMIAGDHAVYTYILTCSLGLLGLAYLMVAVYYIMYSNP